MQSGRVPFRVHDSRKFVLGSLAGHVGVTLLFSMLGAALLSPPPPLQLVKVNLQTLELPREVTPEAPPPIAEPVRSEPEPEPVVEQPEPLPAPPEEVRAARPESEPEVQPAVVEEVPVTPEPTAPEFELPREANPVPQVEPEDVDFPEPAAVQASRPEAESPPAEAPASVAEPEEVSEGAVVQASASEGIEDFYLSRVQMKIGRGWRPTDVGTRGARAVSCVVSFRIGPQGAVIAPTVIESSGFSVFDRRALAAVEGAAPLPPPPSRFGDAGVEINFRFSYSR
jgi:TonB family protein